jgi:hypothetical protein
LNKATFDRAFSHHLGYKNNIIRIRKKKLPVHEGRIGQLPPLNAIDGHRSADSKPSPGKRTGSSHVIGSKHEALHTDGMKSRKPTTTKSVSQPKKLKTVVSHRASDAVRASEKDEASRRGSMPLTGTTGNKEKENMNATVQEDDCEVSVPNTREDPEPQVKKEEENDAIEKVLVQGTEESKTAE